MDSGSCRFEQMHTVFPYRYQACKGCTSGC